MNVKCNQICYCTYSMIVLNPLLGLQFVCCTELVIRVDIIFSDIVEVVCVWAHFKCVYFFFFFCFKIKFVLQNQEHVNNVLPILSLFKLKKEELHVFILYIDN